MVDSKVNVDCFQEEKDSKVSWIDARLSRVQVEKTLTKVEFSKSLTSLMAEKTDWILTSRKAPLLS